MLWTLVFVACLASNPVDCKTKIFRLESGVIPVAPYIEAQTTTAEWLKKNPTYRLRSMELKAGESGA